MRLVVGMLVAALLGALPSQASAKDLCIQAKDGLVFVLKAFHLKKGNSFAVNGWTVDPQFIGPPANITYSIVSPLTGQGIATGDGKHVAMDLTQGGSAFTRSANGTLGGGGAANVRFFHSLQLNAAATGGFGDGASGFAARLQVTSGQTNFNVTPADSSLTVSTCPKDLGALGLPTGM
jgi:hypothetical protein